MELNVKMDSKKVFNATNAIYINGQMLGEDKVDVVFSKRKIANANTILDLKDGTSVKVVGFIQDGERGKKFLATAFRVGDVIHTTIPVKEVDHLAQLKNLLEAMPDELYAEAQKLFTRYEPYEVPEF